MFIARAIAIIFAAGSFQAAAQPHPAYDRGNERASYELIQDFRARADAMLDQVTSENERTRLEAYQRLLENCVDTECEQLPSPEDFRHLPFRASVHDFTRPLSTDQPQGAADTSPPTLNSLTVSPGTLNMASGQDTLTFTYDVEDNGPSGLDYINVTLDPIGPGPSFNGPYVRFDGAPSAQGTFTITVPETIASGEYDIDVTLKDEADNYGLLNWPGLANPSTITINNPNSDTSPPTLNSLTVSPGTLNMASGQDTLTFTYDVEDNGPSGLDYINVTLDPIGPGPSFNGPYVRFDGAPSAQGTFTITVPETIASGEYDIDVTLKDEADNYGLLNWPGLANPSTVWINRTGAQNFGPFDWVSNGEAGISDIFRVTGLHSAPPERIQIALTNTSTLGYHGDFNDCELTVRPARHSGSEYLITRADLADCGDFRHADMRFMIQPSHNDLDSTIRMRRFKISASGMLTDMSIDASPSSSRDTGIFANFGAFEWVEVGNGLRQTIFRIAGLNSAPRSIRVDISNASEPGFEGGSASCQLAIFPERMNGTEYQFTDEDLLACAAFGRADLSFRVEAWDNISDEISMRRYVTSPSGALTDFSFDHESNAFTQATPIDDQQSEAFFGPFEWTGDAAAPTRNLFRITGIRGAPSAIEVALENASVPGYSGTFEDCSLTVSSIRTGAGDYLISSDDFQDCGSFIRADVSFRILGLSENFSDTLRMRRFALGAQGDLTDFGFDHDQTVAQSPVVISEGVSQVTFGPFEWTGDHRVSTQNVFRISGISGVPDKIEVALDNSTSGAYSGEFTDCLITPRPTRSGQNEYVIVTSDLADCGEFERADTRFRITAPSASFAADVRMRRFAVTRNGGLTDFGSDNP